MTGRSWRGIRRAVFERAMGCCEYCQTCQDNIGQSMEVEHIVPDAGDALENLCLACANCNRSKGAAVAALDPRSGKTVRLFNPRAARWDDHFAWREGGLVIEGRTEIGRATVAQLRMNRPHMVRARQRWIVAGFHPPTRR